MKIPYISSQRTRNFAAAGLFLTLTVCIILLTHNLRLGMQRTNAALENIRLTTADVKEYVGQQTDMLEKNKRSIEAGLQLAAAAKGSVQYTNRFILPEARNALAGLSTTQADLRQTIEALRDLTAHTDTSINGPGGVMAATTGAINHLTIGLDEIVAAVRVGVREGTFSLQQANALLANPDIPRLLKSLADGGEGLVAVEASLKKNSDDANAAVRQFATLMADFDKYAKTANRWQKLLILARIVGLLGGLPIP